MTKWRPFLFNQDIKSNSFSRKVSVFLQSFHGEYELSLFNLSHKYTGSTTAKKGLTLLFNLVAPSRDAPVYIEQKSYNPGKTGLKDK